ncbi:aminopeptidase [Candidatus Woesearchaeota archaeon]|nr:aminopeptidase [Candidatus Woesearchaeota archaeon]
MPLRCARGKPRFAVKTTKTGKRVRLAFCGGRLVDGVFKGGKVIEAKALGKRKK